MNPNPRDYSGHDDAERPDLTIEIPYGCLYFKTISYVNFLSQVINLSKKFSISVNITVQSFLFLRLVEVDNLDYVGCVDPTDRAIAIARGHNFVLGIE